FAGFSDVAPWFPVNPNYKTINVAQQQQDPNSILRFYRALIKLKKSQDIITYETFNLVDSENSQVFAYTRELDCQSVLIIGNITNQEAKLYFDMNVIEENILLHNYKNNTIDFENIQPYEAFVIKL